jgi:tight adherence protein B
MMQLVQNNFLIMAVLSFVAIVLVIESFYLLWRSSKGAEATKVRSRLAALTAVHDRSQQARILKERLLSELSPIERLALRLPHARAVEAVLLQSGLGWTEGKLFGITAAGALAGFMAAQALHQSWVVILMATLLALSLPWLYVLHRRSKRLQKMEQQLPDALDLLVRGARAGHAFAATLKMAGEELPAPIGGEFRATHDEINFGVSLQQALTNLSERVPISDVRFFVVAVLIQRESGGNLTEILGNLSHLIRERLKLLARVRVLTSEGRLSAWILALMPFALAGLLQLMNPAFMGRLWTDPIGISIVKTMLTMMAIGILLMRKIIRIRV